MSNLYKCVYDAKETQIGFSLKYFPRHALSENLQRMIKRTKVINIDKNTVLAWCNHDQSAVEYDNSDWNIVWQNNAVPTVLEWDSVHGLRLELRETSLHGKVAILSKL